ncbi:hypothetical protein Trco_003567 [Trichoderma cornu-damae]|uniref:Uncharacterized protein n=1 Tax=Trichoderma cornu-damae TaxID=654480 RepID=A0A9P8TXE8_9HYPO|nr:hypothetical protein Trco_003567 [Trichoderma cornu-damae]
MDSYDDDIQRQQYHPSHSIPDAAYPDDSPFRQQQLRLQASHGAGGLGVSPLHPSAGMSPLSCRVGDHQAGFHQPQHHLHQPQQHHGGWTPYDIPSSPPPPYDPGQAPSAYPRPQTDATTLAAPAARPNARVDVHAQAGAIEMVPLQVVTAAAASTSAFALTPAGNAAAEDPYKLDAAASERRRKQRRLKVCVIVLVVVFMFCGALIIGVALGILKGALNKPPDRDLDF